MNYKKNEIKQYFEDFINDIDKDTLNELIENQELHQEAFNTDYYIIGTYKAKQWLSDKVFDIIEFIKEYEQDNFGEVYTDFSDPEILPLIKSVTGIVGFLGSKDSPVPLRQSELARILGTADDLTGTEDVSSEHYLAGEAVKVTDGPFNDFDGVVEEVNEEKKKLKVMVKIFGRRTPLELNYNQVQKL